jgi:hypothetical protein
VFKIGEAFPVDDPVAIFLVAMSTALNDLLTTAKWFVGGDHEQPFQREVTNEDHLYLLRLSFAQLHEVRETIKHARKQDEKVETFLRTLPESARQDLARFSDLNTSQDQWINQAVSHVRNQANHYGGKWNWDDLKWAMKQVADEQGVIEMVNAKLIGTRFSFADTVAVQHFTRKFPEYVADSDAELDPATSESRVTTLFETMAQASSAARNFAVAALDAYLDTLPDSAISAETPLD